MLRLLDRRAESGAAGFRKFILGVTALLFLAESIRAMPAILVLLLVDTLRFGNVSSSGISYKSVRKRLWYDVTIWFVKGDSEGKYAFMSLTALSWTISASLLS